MVGLPSPGALDRLTRIRVLQDLSTQLVSGDRGQCMLGLGKTVYGV